MQDIKKINHSNLCKPVYDKVKSMILNNRLLPGEKIIQEKLASELGVSRTPLAKALQMLEYENLVESIPRRGVYVKKINLGEMLEVFDCREGLEAVAARLAAEKHDPSIGKKLKKIFAPFRKKEKILSDKYRLADELFHFELIKSSGNKLLIRLYNFDNLFDKIIHMGLVRPPEETLDEHLKIIEAISKNDPDLAVNEVIKHIRKSKELIAAAMLEKKKNTNV